MKEHFHAYRQKTERPFFSSLYPPDSRMPAGLRCFSAGKLGEYTENPKHCLPCRPISSCRSLAVLSVLQEVDEERPEARPSSHYN